MVEFVSGENPKPKENLFLKIGILIAISLKTTCDQSIFSPDSSSSEYPVPSKEKVNWVFSRSDQEAKFRISSENKSGDAIKPKEVATDLAEPPRALNPGDLPFVE